jgi:heme/copper-type cytochrome/quinol oxidase subunit 3
MTIATFALILANVLCVFVAQRMAKERSKSPTPWMWAAALFGPLPLLALALLSQKHA